MHVLEEDLFSKHCNNKKSLKMSEVFGVFCMSCLVQETRLYLFICGGPVPAETTSDESALLNGKSRCWPGSDGFEFAI